MKQLLTVFIASLVVGLVSTPAYAYFSGDYLFLDNSSLKGINTVSVEVIPPVQSVNSELKHYGVSSENLEKKISERLQAAGIKVISKEQAVSDPQGAQLKLRIHLFVGMGRLYSWGLNLSLNQNTSLGRPDAFYPVRTWSTGKNGGVQQTNLQKINGYSMQLVDQFIAAHREQN